MVFPTIGVRSISQPFAANISGILIFSGKVLANLIFNPTACVTLGVQIPVFWVFAADSRMVRDSVTKLLGYPFRHTALRGFKKKL